jgi:hypothetical protein
MVVRQSVYSIQYTVCITGKEVLRQARIGSGKEPEKEGGCLGGREKTPEEDFFAPNHSAAL